VTLDLLVLASPQADVHPADERGVAVGEGGQRGPVGGEGAGQLASALTVRLEPQGGGDLVAGALALFVEFRTFWPFVEPLRLLG